MNKIKIEIVKWNEYQTRSDLKSMTWFRLESSLPENPTIFKMDFEGKWFFVYILCLCAKKANPIIITDVNYLSHYSLVDKKKIPVYLQILHDSDLIRYESVTDSLPTIQYITEHNNTKQTEQYCSSFENLWSAYERKGSKKDAYGVYLKDHKGYDLNAIIAHISHYKQTVEAKYRKHFERYLKSRLWEGWVDSGCVVNPKTLDEMDPQSEEYKKRFDELYGGKR